MSEESQKLTPNLRQFLAFLDETYPGMDLAPNLSLLNRVNRRTQEILDSMWDWLRTD